MLCCIWAIANKDLFPVLVDIELMPFFLGDNYIDNTAKSFKVADILPFIH